MATTHRAVSRRPANSPLAASPAGTHRIDTQEPTDVLIDAENLFPGGWWRYGTAQLTGRLEAVLELAPSQARVLVVCCAALAGRLLDVVLAAKVDLRVVFPTPDAADLLLAHHLKAAPKSAHILLVTGDGGLTTAVAGHLAAGGRVTLAAVPNQLSRRLRAAASATHLLHLPAKPTTTTTTDAHAVPTLRDAA